jgi:hypothetical protein
MNQNIKEDKNIDQPDSAMRPMKAQAYNAIGSGKRKIGLFLMSQIIRKTSLRIAVYDNPHC